ncbi:MAG: KpsF/GutQ family sugar-phosphate isomerase [Eubacteriales bacterium]
MDLLKEAREVIDTEINALEVVRDSLDSVFIEILESITHCKGKVIITGMGKSSHIGSKIAATMASLGTQSFFLHPAEALHGDLGMVSEEDLIIAISYSGESDEIIKLIPNIKAIGATLIGVSGNADSTLIRHSNVGQVFPPFKEACNLGLAPSSSTTAALAYGDALAIVASKVYGFTESNFGLYHPAGALGKRLLVTVKDIMIPRNDTPTTHTSAMLTDILIGLSEKNVGIVSILNDDGTIAGIITDGDLRRLLKKGVDIYNLGVNEIMTKNPTIVSTNDLAIDILRLLQIKRFPAAPVVDENNVLVGAITLQKILDIGIV